MLRHRARLGIILFASWLCFSGTANAYPTAWIFGTPNNSCGQATLPNVQYNCQRFKDGLTSKSWPAINIGFYMSESVQARMFTDISKVSYGQDIGFSDSVDVMLFNGHGVWFDFPTVDNYYFVMGGTANQCTVIMPNEVLWGSNTRVALMHTCQSLQREAYQSGTYDAIRTGNKFKVLNGYHGNAYDAKSNGDWLYKYARDSQTAGVGDNWVDYFTYTVGGNKKQCATSLVYAPVSEVNDIFHNRGLNDFSNSAFDGYSAYYQVCNCQPASAGSKLTC